MKRGYYEKRFGYKPADKKAPRYRRNRFIPLTPKLFRAYKKAHPHTTLDYLTFKRMILRFNERMRELIIAHRDGVELPMQLGFIFIGSCPKKRDNPNPVLSAEHDQKINYRNWDSNQYLCKIFYSNFGTKYRFQGRRHWYFKSCRVFKTEVSRAYKKHWNRYIKVSPFKKIAALYREGARSVKFDL